MRRLFATALLLLPAARLDAQDVTARLLPGQVVRFDAHGPLAGRIEGTVVSHTADSLSVRRDGVVFTIHAARISGLEAYRGKDRARGARRGAVWGTAAGLAFGALIAAAKLDHPICYDWQTECPEPPPEMETVFVSGVAGALMGAGIGAWRARSVWEPLTLPVSASLVPVPGGVGVVARWEW